jgi:hypothetical protein|nr:MAG TPA: hypothetical protein [Crassvirales sp.]
MSFIDENIWFVPIPDCMRINQRENNRISGKTTETLGRLAKEIKLLKRTIKTFRKEKAYTIDIKQAEIMLDRLKDDFSSLSFNRNFWFKNMNNFRIDDDYMKYDYEYSWRI